MRVPRATRAGARQRTKTLLAWYSEAYPASRPCQMQLTAALLAAQRDGDPLWGAQTRTGSRGPLILVHQPAKPIALHHMQIVRVGSIVSRRWTVRRREVQASVRPMAVVMINVDGQDTFKVPRTQHEQPIEALGTDRPNESFRDRVRLRRLNRRANDANAGAPKIRRQSCA
jgi:hypothetical protein